MPMAAKENELATIAEIPSQPREPTPVARNAEVAEDQYPKPAVENSPSSLNLPYSAADGLIRTLFARPIDTAKPVPVLELTSEQQSKYDQVLQDVAQWTTVPTTSAKNAPSAPITDDERMFLTRECILRYLRATKWNVVDATTRLRATLTWRREYGVEEHTADYISIENETGKQVIIGYDINARPCLYLNPARQNTEHSDRQIQHLVFMLERVVDLMVPNQETLALLVNFKETRSGQNSTIGQGRQTLHILQNHYPERLGRALVINGEFPPWIVTSTADSSSSLCNLGLLQIDHALH